MSEFLNINKLQNLVKQKHCYKNPEKPSCIGLILKNCHIGFLKHLPLRKKRPYSELFWSVFFRMRENAGKMRTRITPNTDSFYAVCVLYIGLSDLQKVTITVIKTQNQAIPKLFEIFSVDLDNELLKNDIYNMKYQHFLIIFLEIMEILNKNAPDKKKYIRGSQISSMTPNLCKAIMIRIKLRNKFIKEKK